MKRYLIQRVKDKKYVDRVDVDKHTKAMACAMQFSTKAKAKAFHVYEDERVVLVNVTAGIILKICYTEKVKENMGHKCRSVFCPRIMKTSCKTEQYKSCEARRRYNRWMRFRNKRHPASVNAVWNTFIQGEKERKE